jgi:hypothetical protein
MGQELVVRVKTPPSTWQAPASPQATAEEDGSGLSMVDAVPGAYRVSISLLR